MTSKTWFIKVGERYHDTTSTKFFDLKGHNEISQIFLSTGNTGVNSIQFQYMENGNYELSEQYGAKYINQQFQIIELNHPAEYITSIYGIYGRHSSDKLVSITFTSNFQEYGPFGVTDSIYPHPTSFTYNLGNSGQFGGFHGAYNQDGVTSLGLYLKARTVPPSLGSKIPKKEA